MRSFAKVLSFSSILLLGCSTGSTRQSIDFQDLPFATLLEKAKGEGKQVLLEFYTKTCCPLNDLHEFVFGDPEAIDFVNAHFISARLDADSKAGKELLQRYGLWHRFPAVLIADANGEEIDRIYGVYPRNHYLAKLKDFARNKNSFGELAEKAKSHPEDYDLTYQLAEAYNERNRLAEAAACYEKLVRHQTYAQNDGIGVSLFLAYVCLFDSAKARATLDKALMTKPSSRWLLELKKNLRSNKFSFKRSSLGDLAAKDSAYAKYLLHSATRAKFDHSNRAAAEKQCGVSWEAPQPLTESDFGPLVRNHVNWMALRSDGRQKRFNEPEISFITGGGMTWWSETDIGIIATAMMAREHGIKTLLKPHIELSDGKWRVDIEMQSEEGWQQWFENYGQFILHHAKLAEKYGLEALAIGTELNKTVHRRADWEKLIRKIRAVYNGKLTFAANWHQEFEAIEFWDKLDFIGIQAYFPLTETESPSLAELKRGWQPFLERIKRLHEKFRRPVNIYGVGLPKHQRCSSRSLALAGAVSEKTQGRHASAG